MTYRVLDYFDAGSLVEAKFVTATDDKWMSIRRLRFDTVPGTIVVLFTWSALAKYNDVDEIKMQMLMVLDDKKELVQIARRAIALEHAETPVV